MMKKFLLSALTLAVFLPAICFAQPRGDARNIAIRDARVVRADTETVDVSFSVELGSRVTAPNRSLVMIPSLRAPGNHRSELPAIVVRGERADPEVENRAMIAVGASTLNRGLTSNGKTFDYYATVEWEDWMEGSQLVLDGLNTGRGRTTEVELGLVAAELMTRQWESSPEVAAPLPEPIVLPDTPYYLSRQAQQAQSSPASPALPAPVYQPVGLLHSIATAGDELAARFEFVEHLSRYIPAREVPVADPAFDYGMPLIFGRSTEPQVDDVDRFVEMTRRGATYLEFPIGSGDLDRDLGENNQRLVDLISSIRVLESDPRTRISCVIAVGFTSPEGSLEERETLALERAGVVRDFLTANSRIDPSKIGIFNGSVDWMTLRTMIAGSHMPEKYKVLDIIDNVPAWEGDPRFKGRLDQLIALNDGAEFRYMRELFFPQLRRTGVYLKVYYENVP